MKKVLALALAAVMVLALCGAAFAAAGDLPVDGSITITGLDNGDKVRLYKVVQWVDGQGWALTTDFAGVTGAEAITTALNAGTDLTKAQVEAIANVADELGSGYTQSTVSGTTFNKTIAAADAGMYLALVIPANPATVYNPILVSADFDTTNTTDSIDTSATLAGTAVVKKKPVDITKEVDVNTNDVGDTFHFTVTTTVPVFTSVFESAYFTISDTLDSKLDLVSDSLKINNAAVNAAVNTANFTYTPAAHGFTISATDSYLYDATRTAEEITITYDATLNVPLADCTNVYEAPNDVQIKFPNNPVDNSDYTIKKDGTRQYTFTIDGSLFGRSSYQTGEVVKIGVDAAGNVIESSVMLSNGSWHGALKGATFQLYTDPDCADGHKYSNTIWNGEVVTDENGLMTMPGLDAGTYYLKEIDAPDGYIKSTDVFEIKITAAITPHTVTEYYDKSTGKWSTTPGDGKIACTYDVDVLDSYTVEVKNYTQNGAATTSTYTMTLDGPNLSEFTPRDNSTEIANKKGVPLPSTGGIGTTIFYVSGLLMVLGASTILVSRRRADAE